MRADAKPAVRGASPVLQVMTAFEARPRPIGNLVVNVAGPGKALGSFHIKSGKDVVFGKRRTILTPGAALFHVKHVDRDMFRQETLDPIQVFAPDFQLLLG